MSSMNDVARLKDIDNLADQTAQAINHLAQNGGSSSAVSGSNVLDTVPATVDGGLWYEVVDGSPVVKFHYGGKDFALTSSRVLPKGLVSWLRFDTDMTTDECGLVWTVQSISVNDATISVSEDGALSGNALLVDQSGILFTANTIPLGGKDFTVHFWAQTSANGAVKTLFQLLPGNAEEAWNISITKPASRAVKRVLDGSDPNGDPLSNYTRTSGTERTVTNQLAHCALVYIHDSEELSLYTNGQMQMKYNVSIPRANYYFVIGGNASYYENTLYCEQSIDSSFDEFQVYDGVALWTEDFTPPTVDDY